MIKLSKAATKSKEIRQGQELDFIVAVRKGFLILKELLQANFGQFKVVEPFRFVAIKSEFMELANRQDSFEGRRLMVGLDI